MSDNFYTNVQVIYNNILFRGIVDGKRVSWKEPYEPTIFVPTTKPSKYKLLDGTAVDTMKVGTVRETRDFIDSYKDVENFKIYGNQNYQYCYIADKYTEDIVYDKAKLSIVNIDIETDTEFRFPDPETATEKILSITIIRDGQTWVLGMPPEGQTFKHGPEVTYHEFGDEGDMLLFFIQLWKFLDPDIITGWNVQFYDIPYLVNRLTNVFDKKTAEKMSPWGRIAFRTATFYGQEHQAVTLVGTSILDYLEMYKKFTYTQQESYKLDHIADVELGEKKLDYSEYGSLHNFYTQDYQKFIEYNIRDVELVDRLDDKMKFIDMVLALAYSAKVNYQDTFTQVRMWDTLIFNRLKRQNIVLPPVQRQRKDHSYVGAYVKEPQVGMHNWVVSFDLNSLYPHLIQQYNLSPETLMQESGRPSDPYISIDQLLDRTPDLSFLPSINATVTPNDEYFRTDKRGFLPIMMEELYTERKKYKSMMIEAEKKLQTCSPLEAMALKNEIARCNNMQLARKVQLNSAYGAIGNQYFRFYDTRIAEAITMSGQLAIRWIERAVNRYMNELLSTEDVDYIIASDTDSIYITFDTFIQNVMPGAKTSKIVDFLAKISESKIKPFIDRSYQELADYTNAFDQKMFMDREIIADKGLWTAKKRYILNVHDSEGVRYAEPKLKMMGIEAVKSSTPGACREKIREAMIIMMNDTQEDIIAHIDAFRIEFMKLKPEQVAFPRGINGLKKYDAGNGACKPHTPIHVKGALIYNELLKKHKLGRLYQKIQDSDKIRFLYLKEQNPLFVNVISIADELPEEFGLENYIDYEKQFEKAFIDPLAVILGKMGWTTETVHSLESFFA